MRLDLFPRFNEHLAEVASQGETVCPHHHQRGAHGSAGSARRSALLDLITSSRALVPLLLSRLASDSPGAAACASPPTRLRFSLHPLAQAELTAESIKQVLAGTNPPATRSFTRFTRDQLCEEALLFWIEANDYALLFQPLDQLSRAQVHASLFTSSAPHLLSPPHYLLSPSHLFARRPSMTRT